MMKAITLGLAITLGICLLSCTNDDPPRKQVSIPPVESQVQNEEQNTNTSNTTNTVTDSLTNPSTQTVQLVNSQWFSDLSEAPLGNTFNGWYFKGISIVDEYAVNTQLTHVRQTLKADGTMGNVLSLVYGNERNLMSAPLRLQFDQPLQEFWLQFQYRIAAGQQIMGLYEHKIVYLFTNSSVGVNVNWPGQGDQVTLQPRNTSSNDIYYPRVRGWTDVFGNSTAPADGSYHQFEFHFSLAGVFQMWVDGILVADSSGLDFGSNAFTYVYLPHNHNQFNLSSALHDIDAIKIVTPDYANFVLDQAGNKMIGG
ncbi:MAG: hypothetical protein OEY38_14025 [Gammaproteobacteria bacterium]|nr:hypothetical protein [Gammaproteobacteria bacterium]